MTPTQHMTKQPLAPRPNIIFIVADDLGFADLGCRGGRAAQFAAISPVLDGLAANGLKFTQGHANSPVCSPTRFSLMTARYQYRLRGAAEEPIHSHHRVAHQMDEGIGQVVQALRMRGRLRPHVQHCGR